ncbi:MAG: 3-dehydroquinate synthase [Desulfurococcales archaeon]|nr:3-dehydroquinate synthase [Desulfurococcales archaeon]
MDETLVALKYVISHSKETSIVIGEGSLERLAREVAPLHDKAFLVVDEAVFPTLKGMIGETEWHGVYLVAGGEASKDLTHAEALWRLFYRDQVGRGSLIVGVGGGSLLDLVGFVSSTFARGTRLALVPTTTLSMADAAIGGKNAVNLGSKNIIGTFYHPDYVIIDPLFFDTMPREAYIDGFSEIVKHAVIEGPSFLGLVEESVTGILRRDKETVLRLIAESIKVKMGIVARDFSESDARRILNLGHTIGHALEAASGYRVSHGKSVAVGLSNELSLSVELSGLDPSEAERINRILSRIGFPTRLPCGLEPQALMSHIARDKKRIGGSVYMPLVEAPGKVLVRPVSLGWLGSWLERSMKECAQW